jgi:insertion element IS1 protein InsB
MLEKLNDTLNSLNLNITHVYSDNNFAYRDVISYKILKIGKMNTQKIERKHLTFRTRLKSLARKTICYSKSLEMHKILIELLINLIEFTPKLL